MGGAQTLSVAIPRLERFAYIGVFSSGLIGAFPAPDAPPGAAPAAPLRLPASPPPTAAEWESSNAAKLDDASLKKGLRLLWFATGKEDRLIPTTQGVVDLLTKHHFAPVFKESPGGHTWINWRNSVIDGVRLGTITYSYRSMPDQGAEAIAALRGRFRHQRGSS